MKIKKRGFTQKEATWVRGYIERKFGLNKTWPQQDQRQDAMAAFEKIGGGNEEREIYQWCRYWLSSDQWKTLKSTLGAWRYYQAKPNKGKKSLALENEAWLYLTTLAKREGVSVSRFLIDRLKHEYNSLINRKG